MEKTKTMWLEKVLISGVLLLLTIPFIYIAFNIQYSWIGVALFIVPFVLVAFVANFLTKIMELEEKYPTIKGIDYNLKFKLSSINDNKKSMEDFLANLNIGLEEKEKKSIIRTYIKSQIAGRVYFDYGVLNIILIFVYIGVVFLNYKNNFAPEPSMGSALGIHSGLITMDLIVWWIFYGESFFKQKGYIKFTDFVSNKIQSFLRSIDNIVAKTAKAYTELIYFIGLYVCFYLILVKVQFYNNDGVNIIIMLILTSIMYYLFPIIICFVFEKIKCFEKINFTILYETLKNDAYLFFFLIYVLFEFQNLSDSFILKSIGILFLFDTYIGNKNKIKNETKLKNSEAISNESLLEINKESIKKEKTQNK